MLRSRSGVAAGSGDTTTAATVALASLGVVGIAVLEVVEEEEEEDDDDEATAVVGGGGGAAFLC